MPKFATQSLGATIQTHEVDDGAITLSKLGGSVWAFLVG